MKDTTIDKIGLFFLGGVIGFVFLIIIINISHNEIVHEEVLDEVCQTKYGPDYTFKEMENTNIVCKIQKVTQQTTIKKEPPT